MDTHQDSQDQAALAKYQTLAARSGRLDPRLADAFEDLTTRQLDALVARLIDSRSTAPEAIPVQASATRASADASSTTDRRPTTSPAPTTRRLRWGALSDEARTIVLAVVALVVSAAGVIGACLALAEDTPAGAGTAEVLDLGTWDAYSWDY